MNFFTHFFTGYAIARGLKYQNDRFEAFYLSAAATIPDFDTLVGLFWPEFSHAVFTHTILGGLLFALVFFGCSVLLLHSFFAKLGIPLTRLLGLTLLGLASHFILDIFTYIQPSCVTDAHLYFWPLWDLSFHMNCIWPGVEYWVRILVEVIYTTILVGILLFYDWKVKKYNPFYTLVPAFWWRHTTEHLPANQMPRTPYIYLGLFVGVNLLALVKYGL